MLPCPAAIFSPSPQEARDAKKDWYSGQPVGAFVDIGNASTETDDEPIFSTTAAKVCMFYQRPDPRLQPWVSHYWLSSGGAPQHVLLPDGCVDVVVARTAREATVWLYGTATQRTVIDVEPTVRYLGVRFLPGQARHFLRMSAAELTDRAEAVKGDDALGLAEAHWLADGAGGVFAELDRLLLRLLARHPPRRLALDNLLLYLHRPQHPSLVTLAASCGLSRRQMERLCRTHVGVSPACFAMIRRCHRALALLAPPATPQALMSLSLASIAAEAGYADQSHMTRELRRFTGQTPGMLRRSGPGADVAFVLSGAAPSHHTASLSDL